MTGIVSGSSQGMFIFLKSSQRGNENNVYLKSILIHVIKKFKK